MFTDEENITTVRIVEFTLNAIVAISCFVQVILLHKGLKARNIHPQEGEDMRALVRFYYGIILSPFFVCTVADIASDLPEHGSWIFAFVQFFVAFYYVLFLSLMVVSSGGWLRLRALLRNRPDETKFFWFFLRMKNAWYGLVSRFWMCQLIFFKPFANLLIAAYYQWKGDQSRSNFVSFVSMLACLCTVIPVIGIAMFNYTLTQKGMIAFTRTGSKVMVLRLLTPITQFAQTIIELLVARGRITGNDKNTAMELGHRMLSFILSISMFFVSLLTFWAYRASDFDEVSEQRLRAMSMQRLSVEDDGTINYGGGELPILESPQDVYPQNRDVDQYIGNSDLSEKLINGTS